MKADHNEHDGGHLTGGTVRPESIEAHYEVGDVELRGIVVFMAGLTVMTVVVYLLMLLMFNLLSTHEEIQETRTTERSVMAQGTSEKNRLPPEPRLQSAPGFAQQLGKEVGVKEAETSPEKDQPKDRTWELQQLQTKWEDELSHGARDESGKRVGISITAAKEQLLSGSQKEETRAEDYAVDMPTGASSGRMTEKRKQ